MDKVISYLRKEPINILLLALPLVILAELLHWDEMAIFALSALAIVPMAGYIGASTEVLATRVGPRVGGLLNATLGNAAELIITIVAIRAGLLDLVKASITGSILGNILLVLGMSMLLGGIRNGMQFFDRRQAGNNAILLVLSVIALVIPSMISGALGEPESMRVEALSIGAAVIMMVLYGLGILYSFRVQASPLSARPSGVEKEVPEAKAGSKKETQAAKKKAHGAVEGGAHGHHPSWSLRTAFIVLGISTAGVAFLSELLVGAVEPVVVELGISEFFLGMILIPIVGNVAEHLVAVKVAIQDQMELSVEIAIASSLQIALFVAPVLVFVSLLMGHPLQLIFNEFELLALTVGVLIAALVSQDGESNWLEGAALMAVYVMLGLAFLLLPV